MIINITGIPRERNNLQIYPASCTTTNISIISNMYKCTNKLIIKSLINGLIVLQFLQKLNNMSQLVIIRLNN